MPAPRISSAWGGPLCVQPDAPKRLINGMAMLPKKEAQLQLFAPWLASLRKLKTMRGLEGFAVQYWFYSQLYSIGRLGRPNPDMTVYAAMREVEAYQKRWMKERRQA